MEWQVVCVFFFFIFNSLWLQFLLSPPPPPLTFLLCKNGLLDSREMRNGPTFMQQLIKFLFVCLPFLILLLLLLFLFESWSQSGFYFLVFFFFLIHFSVFVFLDCCHTVNLSLFPFCSSYIRVPVYIIHICLCVCK